MTLTINLSDEQATALEAKAAAEGLSVEEWIKKLAAAERPFTCHVRHIADDILDNMKDVPPEITATMPARPLHLRLAEEAGMTALFADTFYWIALADAEDTAHRRALALTSTMRGVPIVTTDEVLAEYLTFFATAHENMRRKAVINACRILQNPGVRVIPQTHASFLSGMELYEARPDKGYSLTDCVSMQTMRREGLTEALTNDRHFEQEAFRPLFRD
jgi:uncharacterized protein